VSRQTGSQRGSRFAGSPLCFRTLSTSSRHRNPCHDRIDQAKPPTVREGANAIIKTPRLLLRAPRAEDAASIATIANDRRIAENTVRIPHPYTLADAQAFIAYAGSNDHEVAFVVTLPDGHIIGSCGMGSPGGNVPRSGIGSALPIGTKAMRPKSRAL